MLVPSSWGASVSTTGSKDGMLDAYFGERDRRFRERDRFERSVL